MSITVRDVAAIIADTQGTSGRYFNTSVIDARVSFDDSRAPVMVIELTIPTPSLSDLALLTTGPSGLHLVVGTIRVDAADRNPTRQWEGVIQSVTQPSDGQVSITAVGAEQTLIDYTPTAPDKSYWSMQSSVADIWTAVIDKTQHVDDRELGASVWHATIDPVAANLPFRTYRNTSNLIANGGFESGTSSWTGAGCTIAADGAWSSTGAQALRLFPSTSSTNSYAFTDVAVQPNTTYTVSASCRIGAFQVGGPDAAARRILVSANAGGSGFELGRSAQAAQGNNVTTRLSVTFTTPAMLDSNVVRVRLYHGQTSSAYSAVLWDDVLMVEGDGTDTDGTPVSYFDGDTADGRNGYTYDWQGSARVSSSTRTAILDRDEDTLTWKPGQSAWDFLEPILQASGLRTYASGWFGTKRYFEATLASTQNVPTSGIWNLAAGLNLYDLEVRRDRNATHPDGTPSFADAVVIHYTWTDGRGIEQERYDIYAPDGYTKPWTLEQPDTPFPGAGRARYLYRRMQARRGQLVVTCRIIPEMRQGAQVAISHPNIGFAFAYVDSVDHDLVQGVTTIRTKDYVDYPNEAWSRLPTGTAWTASPVGASWTTETTS